MNKNLTGRKAHIRHTRKHRQYEELHQAMRPGSCGRTAFLAGLFLRAMRCLAVLAFYGPQLALAAGGRP